MGIEVKLLKDKNVSPFVDGIYADSIGYEVIIQTKPFLPQGVIEADFKSRESIIDGYQFL